MEGRERLLFNKLDADASGFLEAAEITTALRNMKIELAPENERLLLKRVDVSGDGRISFTEFKALLHLLLEFRKQFKLADKDNSGAIDVDELQGFLTAIGCSFSKRLCEKYMELFDVDGNGSIDFQEFFSGWLFFREIDYLFSHHVAGDWGRDLLGPDVTPDAVQALQAEILSGGKPLMGSNRAASVSLPSAAAAAGSGAGSGKPLPAIPKQMQKPLQRAASGDGSGSFDVGVHPIEFSRFVDICMTHRLQLQKSVLLSEHKFIRLQVSAIFLPPDRVSMQTMALVNGKLCCGLKDGVISVRNPTDNTQVRSLSVHGEGERIYSIVEAGGSIFSSSTKLIANNAISFEVTLLPSPHKCAISCLLPLKGGSQLISGDVEGTVALWDAASKRLLKSITLEQQSVFSLCEYQGLIWVGGFCNVFILDSDSLAVIARFRAHDRPVSSLCVAHGSVWSCASDAKICLWNYDSVIRLPQLVRKFDGQATRLLALDDGNRVLATNDLFIAVYSSRTCARQFTLETPHKEAMCGVVPVGNTTLYSAGLGGSVATWQITFPETDPYPDQPPVLPVARSSQNWEKITLQNWGLTPRRETQWLMTYPDVPSRSMIKLASDSYEFGVVTATLMDTHELEDMHKTRSFYKDGLEPTQHSHFIGASPDGPVIVSVEDNEQKERMAMIRTRKEDARILVSKGQKLTEAYPALAEANLYKVTDGDNLSIELLAFEQKLIVQNYKFGVLYQKKNQADEVEWYNNRDELDPVGSAMLYEFLDMLGQRIALKGWSRYRGGLNVQHDSTGTHSYYTEFRDLQLMFHVANLIPYYEADHQQVERKRHLGNDVVIIVFREPGCTAPFDMSVVKSQFNHVFLLVEPDLSKPTRHYKIAVASKVGVIPYGPELPAASSLPKGEQLRDWVLAKCVNGERAAMYAPDFRGKAYNTRKAMLADISSRFPPSTKGSARGEGGGSGVSAAPAMVHQGSRALMGRMNKLFRG